MKINRRLLCCLAALAMGAAIGAWPAPAPAYVGGPPLTLGMMCWWSTHAIGVEVERVDRGRGLIVYRKTREYKGKWPSDIIIHQVGQGVGDRAYIMQWAEPGKTTCMFALESYKWGYTYIDSLWYASNTADWRAWNVSHPQPLMLRGFAGKPEKLSAAVGAIVAGREVVVSCMVDDMPALQQRRAKLQRVRAGFKLLDYNPKRDFVDVGGDDFVVQHGMPGFSHSCTLPRVGADAQAISIVDFDGDKKPDVCLLGANKLVLLQNSGDALLELAIPGLNVGGRAAVWADYNGDGRPDLFLAALDGPRLYTNLGNGNFQDDSRLVPREDCWDLSAAAWMDYDGDGKPDLLLGNGFHGLRLYKNMGAPEILAGPPTAAGNYPTGAYFRDVSAAVGFGPEGLGSTPKGDALAVCDVDGDGRPDILYAAGPGKLFLNKPMGFIESADAGIAFKSGKVGPVFGDFDNDGHPDLFAPQLDGRSKLFKNGAGRFSDVTAKAGDLSRPFGIVTSAAWGDFDNDGRLDLAIGCLKGPNRFFKNKGDGSFDDITEELGLHKKICNSQAVCLVDLNQDGMLDLVSANEGQDSLVLLGNPAKGAVQTPVTLHVGGEGVVGCRVRVRDEAGNLIATQELFGSDGRGGQRSPLARFALKPGTYRVEARYSTGLTRQREITVASAPLRGIIDEQTPRVE